MTGHDAVIFDMDGTLWDAVDSYARVWNATFAAMGLDYPAVTRPQLLDMMGMNLGQIMKLLIPTLPPALHARFLKTLDQIEHRLMPLLGGRLYDGVKETLTALAHDRRLFMVSNCGTFGLDNFLDLTGLKPLMTDWLTHGGTGRPKEDNILYLKDRYSLAAPVYVGDTMGDLQSSHRAGVPMVWARYGFGGNRVHGADAVIDTITQLPAALEQLDKIVQ